MSAPGKAYLGDSVYVDVTDGMLVVTTDNGMGPNNVIYLEPDVWRELKRYAEQVGAPFGEGPEAEPVP